MSWKWVSINLCVIYNSCILWLFHLTLFFFWLTRQVYVITRLYLRDQLGSWPKQDPVGCAFISLDDIMNADKWNDAIQLLPIWDYAFWATAMMACQTALECVRRYDLSRDKNIASHLISCLVLQNIADNCDCTQMESNMFVYQYLIYMNKV